MKISCAIVDDEPIAANGIKKYVDQIEFLELHEVLNSAIALGNYLEKHQVDLLFLDIQMPGLTGVDFLKTHQNPPKTIFTTAYNEFALEGYELDVLDYLLKPVSFERFYKSTQKALSYFKLNKELRLTDHIFLKTKNRLEKVLFENILFIQGMQNYLNFHTKSGTIIHHATMKSMLEDLPEKTFLHVHKSYIVNKNQVKAIEGGRIIIGEDKIPMSREKKDQIVKEIMSS